MKKLLIIPLFLCLFTLIVWAQNAAQTPAVATTGNNDNLLIVLIIVTGVVLVAAVYIILKAVTQLSQELRIHANKRKP